MRIAFFDLDRTILSVNSASLWVQREVREKHISRWQAAQGALWLGAYHLGIANMEAAIERAILSIAGRHERELRQRTEAFWREEVSHTIRPGAHTAIDEHRRRGDAIYLLTSSSHLLSELVCQALELDGYLANRLQTHNGRYTGKTDGGLCYGVGKVQHAEQLVEQLGTSLSSSVFYTDSMTDLPMLRAVGEPRVVHPDPRLGRFAKRMGWPILNWES